MAGAAIIPYVWRSDPTRPELVFGLIGALGAKIREAEESLRDRLIQLGYHVPQTIKLSRLLHDLDGNPFAALRAAPGGKAHVSQYMDAGNDLRARTGRSDAMALLAVTAMRATRAEIGVPEDQSADRVAFIVDSLKHPAEVIVLRQLYGASFIAVAVFNNRDERIASTANRLATRKTVGGLWKGTDAEGGASCSRRLPGASASSDHFRRCRHRWVQRAAQRERHNPYHLGYRDHTGEGLLEEGWLAREMERSKKRVDAMPNGRAEVEFAKQRAEELNRSEVEEYRLQRERERLSGK